MKKISSVILGLCLSFAASSALSEETKPQLSPDQMGDYMEVMIMKMLDVYSSPKIAETQAKFYKNLYDALLRQGFSKSEAMQITISQGSLLSSSSN